MATAEEIRSASNLAADVLSELFELRDGGTDEHLVDYLFRLQDATKELGEAMQGLGGEFAAVANGLTETGNGHAECSVHNAILEHGRNLLFDIAFDVQPAAIKAIPDDSDTLPAREVMLQHADAAQQAFSDSCWSTDDLNRISALREQELARALRSASMATKEKAGVAADDPAKQKSRIEPERRRPNRTDKKSVKLSHWAFGHDGKDWVVFQWFGNMQRWCERGHCSELSTGQPHQLAIEIAETGGAITKEQAVRLFKNGTRKDWKDTKVFDGTVKQACTRLRKAVKHSIARIADCGPIQEDPVPWEQDAWRPQIQIGFAAHDDNGKLVFQTSTQRDADDFSSGFCPD